ncbi:STAS-like domain-containing protein [Brevundimonas sp. M1A4_2e]
MARTITFPPELDLKSYKFLLAGLHGLEKSGKKGITLDFSNTRKAMPSAIIGLISQLSPEISYQFVAPEDKKLASIFKKNCWEFHILRQPFDDISKSVSGSTSLIHVMSNKQVHLAVDQVLKTILTAVPGVGRPQLQALEWSLNEVVDNVFNHGESRNGAYLEATIFKKKRVVEFVVGDSGKGIPDSMKRIGIHNAPEALNQAIKEGVTSNKGYNKGNGLFGTSQIAMKSKGHFLIDSGYARLFYNRKNDSISSLSEKIPFSGTLVHWSVGLDDPDLLKNALVFEGKAHEIYFDFLDKTFDHDGDHYTVFVRDHLGDISTRAGGERFRTLVENLAAADDGGGVIISFADISVISSSFADEVFAKLAEKRGEDWLRRRVLVQRANDVIQGIISREIASRLQQTN